MTRQMTIVVIGALRVKQICSRRHSKIDFIIFQRKQDLKFHVNHLQANDSHEMSSLIFSEKKKKKKKKRIFQCYLL